MEHSDGRGQSAPGVVARPPYSIHVLAREDQDLYEMEGLTAVEAVVDFFHEAVLVLDGVAPVLQKEALSKVESAAKTGKAAKQWKAGRACSAR